MIKVLPLTHGNTDTHPERVAKGRNGYFTPEAVEITHPWCERGVVRLEVFSRRHGRAAPIILQVSKADALALVEAIREVLGDENL